MLILSPPSTATTRPQRERPRRGRSDLYETAKGPRCAGGLREVAQPRASGSAALRLLLSSGPRGRRFPPLGCVRIINHKAPCPVGLPPHHFPTLPPPRSLFPLRLPQPHAANTTCEREFFFCSR